MSGDEFRLAIEKGNVAAVEDALQAQPELANRTIRWVLNRQNESDPLHFVSDCISNDWLKNGREDEIARLLLKYGAHVDGSSGRESPLIAAASLGAEKVAAVLVEAGASLESTSIFGARALHWAAWTGSPSTVRLLIDHGAQIEVKCTEFGATPLFWAVHGYSQHGPKPKKDQVGAAQLLLEAGAIAATSNKDGLSAVDLAKQGDDQRMHELFRRYWR